MHIVIKESAVNYATPCLPAKIENQAIEYQAINYFNLFHLVTLCVFEALCENKIKITGHHCLA